MGVVEDRPSIQDLILTFLLKKIRRGNNFILHGIIPSHHNSHTSLILEIYNVHLRNLFACCLHCSYDISKVYD